jgi:hypothetical protein
MESQEKHVLCLLVMVLALLTLGEAVKERLLLLPLLI